MATDLINAGIGDQGRLEFIIECIQKDKPLYNTDSKYLKEKYLQFEAKIEALSGKKKTKTLVSDEKLNNIIDDILSKPELQENNLKDITPQRKSAFKRLFSKK